jgi:ribosome-associated protein
MELLGLIKEALDKVKATDVKIYDLRGISPLADFTIVATVDVARQANACIEHIADEEKNQKLKIKNVEGRDTTWILVDLYDVILHIFTPEERSNYDLDRLYLNIPQINL